MIPTQTPQHWIGKTARIANKLWAQIPKLQTTKDPLERRYLFTGEPGLGKTDLAEHLAAAISGEDYEHVHARMALNVELINGQSCNIETVRRWQNNSMHRPMFGSCYVQLVDEIDAISPAALNEIRTYLDRLPPATVFLATTNKPVDQLQEQLQSRFKVCYFDKVEDEELLVWLVDVQNLPVAYAERVVAGAKGNVRAAKLDALAWKEVNA